MSADRERGGSCRPLSSTCRPGTSTHRPLPTVRFPDAGRPEADVLDDVRGRFDENRFEHRPELLDHLLGHPVRDQPAGRGARPRAGSSSSGPRESELGTLSMEREAVAMMASLLGGDDRCRRASSRPAAPSRTSPRCGSPATPASQAEPEIIAPVTMHFSFRLGAELMGIKLVEIDVDDDTYLPRIEDVERAITPRTVGLVCSAPGGSFGVLDPVEAFADLARRTGLYLHVDAAFGGFILPFMRDLGLRDPAVRPVARRASARSRPTATSWACCRSRRASSSSRTRACSSRSRPSGR